MKCPKCNEECQQDMVDVGVGEIPCGPAHCDDCQWVEEEFEFDEEEVDRP